MTEEISIHTIRNNMHKARPRQPLVQIIGIKNSIVSSIAFHPRHAAEIVRAIRNAAKSAAAGRNRNDVVIDLTERV